MTTTDAPALEYPDCGFCKHIKPGAHDVCVECGKHDHAGLGMWAVHADEDLTRVHTGRCFRAYQARKVEAKAVRELLATYDRWGSSTAGAAP